MSPVPPSSPPFQEEETKKTQEAMKKKEEELQKKEADLQRKAKELEDLEEVTLLTVPTIGLLCGPHP